VLSNYIYIENINPYLINLYLFESLSTLLEWTQKHDSDRSNKEYCLWLETGWVKTWRSIEEANKSKKGRGRESEVRAGRQGQKRQVRNIL